MSLSVLPFSLQLPSGYSLASGTTTAQAASTSTSTAPASATSASTAASPVDVVSISNTWDAGSFTAEAGDVFRLDDLFSGQAATAGTAIAGYQVALGAASTDTGGGQLLLNGTVTSQTSFTADQFAHLTYTAGADGSQSLVVVAQTGTRLASGTLTGVTDSTAVQITANVGTTRSINAMGALASTPSAADAAVVGVVQQAGIFTGFGTSTRPTLQTAGNFTAEANDVFRLDDLFSGKTATAGTAIAGYQVALGAGSGNLLLNGTVTSQTSFTADQFAHLTYTAGADGSQSLVVVAQTGTRLASGTLTGVTDSTAVQITANVGTTRSINAMGALASTPSAADAAVVGVVQQAGIFTGFGTSTRPTLQTAGNFTAEANDVFRLDDLFSGQTAAAGTAIAGYQVALGDGSGSLLLNGTITSQTSFTADQFAHLTYTAGADGSQQSLVVVAQTGTRLASGTLTGVTDSTAVQITANVGTTRSINAMGALASTPSAADAAVVGVVQQAGIFTGFGTSTRPTLQTAGNFTAEAGDVYRLDDLFSGQAATAGTAIAGYQVALGAASTDTGGGQLLLNGTVTSQTSFTADQFAHLTYTAGADGSQQSLVVVAQTGTRLASGTLTGVTDSTAVQITANVGTTRSINAMGALASTPSAADAAVVGVVQQAGIFTGFGTSARPTLQTAGNFTAEAGDVFRLDDLFSGQTATAGTAIAGYQVALGDGSGSLLLNGTVTSQTSFTADQFAHLTYTAGADGSQQSLVVVAQTGTRLASGTLTGVTDSTAVQITANVGTTRSINAMGALASTPSAADANLVGVVQQAGIFTGFGASTRPTLQTAITPQLSQSALALSTTIGAYNTAGSTAATSPIDLSSFDPAAIGSSLSAGTFVNAGGPVALALLLLDDTATGAFETTNQLIDQSQAIKAYSTS